MAPSNCSNIKTVIIALGIQAYMQEGIILPELQLTYSSVFTIEGTYLCRVVDISIFMPVQFLFNTLLWYKRTGLRKNA